MLAHHIFDMDAQKTSYTHLFATRGVPKHTQHNSCCPSSSVMVTYFLWFSWIAVLSALSWTGKYVLAKTCVLVWTYLSWRRHVCHDRGICILAMYALARTYVSWPWRLRPPWPQKFLRVFLWHYHKRVISTDSNGETKNWDKENVQDAVG